MTSPLASASGLPFSRVIRVARSSAFSLTRSYHLRSSLARERPVCVRKEANAVFAASTALAVSLASNSGQVPISSPVAGSWTSKVLPEAALTHSPLT